MKMLDQSYASESLQQVRERCSESRCDLTECSQSRLACTALQIGNVDFVDAGLLGKVDLPPVPGAAQFPDPFTRRRTDVLCHASMIGLVLALYLAHTLSGIGKAGIMRTGFLLGSLAVTVLLVSSNAAFAKDKQRITIEVVNSEASQRQYTYTTPGWKGTSETNCNTNGTTNGTISDYGVGPIQTHSTDNASTNCTTSTTPATPPQTYVRSITQEHVSAILPDGRQVTLWCQEGFRHCDYLLPGRYEAEIDGNALFVLVRDLSGKERRVKYRAISVQETASAQQAEPETNLAATVPPPSLMQPSANIESAPSVESIATLKEQAIEGDTLAQWNLYMVYETGDGAPQDDAQAMVWLRKAAEHGNSSAQCELGAAYQLGQGVPQDYVQAASWFRKAAEQGNVDAQSFLGDLYENGNGVPQDHVQAAAWYRKAAEQGDADAQSSLASMYEKGQGVQRDDVQAATWFRKAAEQGNADGEFGLGTLYLRGLGLPQDYAEAYFWFDLAASSSGKVAGRAPEDIAKTRNETASHLTQAVLLETQQRARRWFEDHSADTQRTLAAAAPISAPAAVSTPLFPAPASANVATLPSAQSIETLKEQSGTEDAETQFHRGTLFETANGVQQDYAQAVLWYRKAAEQNFAKAQYRLGVLYANGVGVPLDKTQSAAWFQKAAEQGYVYAQEMLGSDYLTGEGVQRDYAEAYFWFDIACASKAREVVAGIRATQRDAAAIYLTPAELSREQERVRKWFEDHPAKPQ